MDSIEKKICLEDENTYKSNKQYFDKYGNIKYAVSDNSIKKIEHKINV